MPGTSISQLIWGSTASLFTAPHQGRAGVQTAMTSFMDGFAPLAPSSAPAGPADPDASAAWDAASAREQASSDMGQVEAQTVPTEAQNPLTAAAGNTGSVGDANFGSAVESPGPQSLAKQASEQAQQREQTQRESDSSESGGAANNPNEESTAAEPQGAEVSEANDRTAEPSNTTSREDDAAKVSAEVGGRITPEHLPTRQRGRGRRNDSGLSGIKSQLSPAQRVGGSADGGRKSAVGEQPGVRGKIGNNEAGSQSAIRGVDSATRINPPGSQGNVGQTAGSRDGLSNGTTAATSRGALGSLNLAVGGEVGNGNNSSRGAGKAAEAPVPPTPTAANTAKLPAHVRGVMAMTHTRGGNLTMKLQPESLGALRVQMSINQGQVSVQFHTQTAEANALIRGSIEGLRSALEAQGFRLEQVSVQPLNRGDAGGHPSGSAENGNRGAGGSGEKHDAGGERSRGFRDEEGSESPRRHSGQSSAEARSFAARLEAHEI